MEKRKVFNGKAIIKIIEAQQLKPTDFSLQCQSSTLIVSPYIYIDIDDLPIGRTQTVKKEANPSYMQEYEVDVLSGYQLNFNIFHNAALPPDQFVAGSSIKFTEIKAKGKNIWLDLEPTGKLHINVVLDGELIEEMESHDKLFRKNSQALKKRRCAKNHKVYQKHGHKFMYTYFKKPTYCSICENFLWGVFQRQGLQCQICRLTIHRGCKDRIFTQCSTAQPVSDFLPDRRFSINMPHRFVIRTKILVKRCSHCSDLIWDSKYLECELCHCRVHNNNICEKSLVRACGVNISEIGDILKDIQDKKSARPAVASGTQQSITETAMPLTKEKNDDNDELFYKNKNDIKREISLPHGVVTQNNDDFNGEAIKKERISKRSKSLGTCEEQKSEKSDDEDKLSEFTFIKVLGRGNFGKVFLGRHKKTEKLYAVKALKKFDLIDNDDVVACFVERDVLLLSSEHPFLTTMFFSFQTKERIYFVMEYLSGGDLMTKIRLGYFDENCARFYSAEIISALMFLHNKGIIYRDLKAENILFDRDGHAKIADFGLCKLGMENGKLTTSFCGTPQYMAPEILNNLEYSFSVDWWALGILMYEMVTCQNPFFDAGTEEDLFQIILYEEIAYPADLTKDTLSILKGFLNKNPTKRLGCVAENGGEDAIKRHPFFLNKIDWDALECKRLDPPIKPKLVSHDDTSNFDIDFTSEKPVMTPVSPIKIMCTNQDEFSNFSFVNPRWT